MDQPGVEGRRVLVQDVSRIVEGTLVLAATVFDIVQRDRVADREVSVKAREGKPGGPRLG